MCGADAVGSAIFWGQRCFGACVFKVDVKNWVLDPFVAERILLPLRLHSMTACVNACNDLCWSQFSACIRSALVWTYLKSDALFQYKDHLSWYGNPMVSRPILVGQHLYIVMDPRSINISDQFWIKSELKGCHHPRRMISTTCAISMLRNDKKHKYVLWCVP